MKIKGFIIIIFIIFAIFLLLFISSNLLTINYMKKTAIGSSQGTLIINDEVKNHINELFPSDKRTFIDLPNRRLKIKGGDNSGLAFGIKNLLTKTEAFSYNITIVESTLNGCNFENEEAYAWIQTGRSDVATIASGETYYGLVRFLIPEGSPLCTVRMHLDVKKDNVAYATDFFDVEILA